MQAAEARQGLALRVGGVGHGGGKGAAREGTDASHVRGRKDNAPSPEAPEEQQPADRRHCQMPRRGGLIWRRHSSQRFDAQAAELGGTAGNAV